MGMPVCLKYLINKLTVKCSQQQWENICCVFTKWFKVVFSASRVNTSECLFSVKGHTISLEC